MSLFTAWNGENDAISSLRPMPGNQEEVALILFEDENYQGIRTTIRAADYTELHAIGWGDRASSMIVVSQVWNVFQHAGFTGNIYTVTSFGGPNRNGFYPNPASWGGPDNDASSVVWVPTWWNPIILYSDADLQGRAVALYRVPPGQTDASMPPIFLQDLTHQNFNDVVSS